MAAPANDILRYIKDDDRNNYTLGRKLGEGGYGAVYEATRRADRQLVACKVQTVKTKHDAFYGRRELNVWQKATYKANHVARLYDAAFNDQTGQAYIYMELLKGGDLHNFMVSIYKSGQTIHPFLVYHLVSQVAFGLSEIHARTIIHRDLKLDNVLLTKKITPEMNSGLWELSRNGTVSGRLEPHLLALCNILFKSQDERLAVLADFGLSRDETTVGGSVTVVGLQWNPAYSAPEMVSHNYQSPMADIYSYGVLVYRTYSALQGLIDCCISSDPLRRPTAGQIIEQLWPLKMAAMAEISSSVQRHQKLKQYAAEMAR
ncbi:kinase-like domain-containing protein [Chaetomidium leptoderma]|uniref:Kinase-like domain-containing protein n=1 Tax=Chaetomidium leptoderma TaxID=669021 RepID=A0AAN6VG69_9PEZI|nr:kinase-like domain-containing protein [Chaetomidium leptoderma]